LFHSIFPNVESRILYSTSNFVVIPGLGQLLEGYLLILPKKHYLSLATMPLDFFPEFNRVINITTGVLEKVYGKEYILFEHGPLSPKIRGGSCSDHAHLHIFPLRQISKIDFLIGEETKDESTFPEEAVRILDEGSPYLFISDYKKREKVTKAENLPSQYMRREIAKSIGRPDEWDWQVFIGKSELLNCILQLKPFFDQVR
jgi:diadenosine tetraphosphate (Ap4A) HIT family hydrolase